MIGQYLETLDAEQEDALLTEKIGRAEYFRRPDGCRCLVGVTEDYRAGMNAFRFAMAIGEALLVAARFDELCGRFGDERIQQVIRSRILTNQARRALRQAQNMVGV